MGEEAPLREQGQTPEESQQEDSQQKSGETPQVKYPAPILPTPPEVDGTDIVIDVGE